MSTWSVPITWTNGAVTAASMNTLRDNLLFVKGALDIISASTTADTGTTMYLDVRRTNSTDPAFRSGVSGAANPEFQLDRNGRMWWGAGGASAVDISLRRGGSQQFILSGTSDPRFEAQFAAVPGATQSFFTGLVTGDAFGRMAMRLRSDGGGILEFGDGTATKGSLYWDAGATATVLSGTAEVTVVAPTASGFQVGSSVVSPWFQTDAATNPRWYLNNESSSGMQRTANGRIESIGRLGAADGVALKVQSGAFSDGSFTTAAESGLTGLDTGGFLYVREGSTWRFIETRGMMMLVGPFTWTNLAASQTDLAGDIGGLGSGTSARYVSPYAGDIVGTTVRGNAVCTAGTATFRGVIITTNATGFCTINTTDTQAATQVQGTGIDVVAAGDRLGMGVTTSAGFTPTGSTEYAGWLHLLVRRR